LVKFLNTNIDASLHDQEDKKELTASILFPCDLTNNKNGVLRSVFIQWILHGDWSEVPTDVKHVSNAWKIYILDRVTHLLLFFLREGT
jgi:hypothetical protein